MTGLLATVLHGIAVPFTGDARVVVMFVRNQLLGLSLMLCMVQILEFLSIHHLFGPWGVIIGHLVIDVLRFLTIALIFGVAFALQLGAVFKPLYIPNTKNGLTLAQSEFTVDKIAEQLFFDIFGLSSISYFDGHNLKLTYTPGAFELSKTIFGVYNVLCLIVLVNLLIAMMSDTYQRIHDRSDVEWKFGRAKLIRIMEVEPARPVPLNLFITLFKFLKALVKMRCNCCQPKFRKVLQEELKGRERHQIQKERKGSLSPLERQITLNVIDDTSEENSKNTKEGNIQSVVDWGQMVVKYYNIKGKLESGRVLVHSLKEDGSLRQRKLKGDGQNFDKRTTVEFSDTVSKVRNVMTISKV